MIKGPVLYYGIYSRYEVNQIQPKGKHPILISVTNSRVQKSLHCPHLLLPCNDIPTQAYPLYNFKEAHLLKLILFLYQNDFDEIIIHCDLGISRSPAVMIGCSKILGIPEIEKEIIANKRFIPNPAIISMFETYQFPKVSHSIKKVVARTSLVWNEQPDDIKICSKILKKEKSLL